MSTLTVMPSEADDAVRLAPYLREADRQEVLAASGMEPLPALRIGYEASTDPQTILEAGYPIAMFGVVPTGDGVGAPWLLGSGRVEVNWFTFLRRSRDVFARVRQPWRGLENHIDERNTLHIRWVQWLGFDLVERVEDYGVGHLPFWRFRCGPAKA